MRQLFSCLLFIIILITSSLASDAQMFHRIRARHRDKPPVALLIQLNSQKNRTDYCLRKNKMELLAILQKDTREVMKRIVLDFSENFYYCPVYFFMDTNARDIMKGNFEGILLDSSLLPMKNIILQKGDTNFFVGTFSIMAPDFEWTDSLQESEYFSHHNDAVLSVPRFYAMDHNFNILRSTLPWTAFAAYSEIPLKRKRRFYKYESHRFNIGYSASALRYSNTLDRFYGPYPYKN